MAANPVPERAGYRLSPEQLAAWALAESAPDAASARGAALLRGALDARAVEAALVRLAARHEVLRTSYRCAPGTRVPLQVIGEAESAVALDLHDLSGVPAPERRRALRALAARPHASPPPVLSASLATLSPSRHLLFLRLPVLAADAETLGVLLAELRALLAGASLPPAAVQYADYAEWRDESLREGSAGATAFWAGAAAIPATRHPLERTGAPGAVRSAALATLGEADAEAVESAAASLGVPTEAFCLAAFEVLLSRIAGEDAVGVGYVHRGRVAPELQDAPGLFARILPLTPALGGSLAFAARAAEAAARLQAAERASEREAPPAFAGPLFAFEASARRAVLAADARLSPGALEMRVARRGAGLVLRLLFDAHRLPPEAAGAMARGLAALLRAAAADPSVAAADLPILGEADRRALVRAWSRSVAAPPAATLAARFEEQARANGSAEAFVCGDERLAYAELNARANRIARVLRARGAAPNVPVGLCLPAGAGLASALLGILKSGAPYLPLAPENPPARLARQIAAAGASLVVTSSALASLFPRDASLLRLDDAEGLLAREDDSDLDPKAAPEDLAYVIATSGSTGTPRAVAVTHRNVAAYADAILALVRGLAPGARGWGAASSIAADLGNTAVFPALLGGGTLHLLPREAATDPALFAAAVREVDVLKLVPSHLRALLGEPPSAEVLPRRVLILGGEPFPSDLAREIRSVAPRLAVVNHYGPTETTVGALAHVVDGREFRRTVPVGGPLAHARALAVDGRGEPVPPGAAGELLIGGEGVARGYLGAPEETERRFVADPFAPGERVYRTGDLVRVLPRGEFEFVGRTDDQVKVRGFRVEPGEIERALEEHEAVRRAFVAVRDGRLVAWVAARAPARHAELAEFLAARLPEHMLPAHVVAVDAFPLLPSGKVDRRALPEPDAAADEFVAPRDAAEASMAAIWSEVLGLPRLSVTANFFDLGGHSLLATQILSRIKRVLGCALAPTVLFENPTVETLARAAARA